MEIHSGSQDTYEKVGTFAGEELPFSKYLRWDRMGLLAILADFYLNYSKGNILEIGAGESTVYFSWLARKYNRQAFFCDIQQSIYVNALTVDGYFQGEHIIIREGEDKTNIKSNFPNTIYIGDSTKMFKDINLPSLAVALIDGGHMYEQVKKDFWNIFPLIEETGAIFLHDLNPPNEEYHNENLCGTGFRLRKELEENKDLDVFTFVRSAINVGLTMVRVRNKNRKYFQA